MYQDFGAGPEPTTDILRKGTEVSYDEIASWIRDCRVLTLLYEADMRVDLRGCFVGFDKRKEDLKKRYGMTDTYKDIESIVKYIFEWCGKNNVPAPPKMREIEKKHQEVTDIERFKAHSDMDTYELESIDELFASGSDTDNSET